MTIVTHLWQSTLCLGLAAGLALALRHTAARTRYVLWLCASIKFLIPLSLFVAAGRAIGRWTAATDPWAIASAVRWLEGPLALWRLDVVAAPAAGAPLVSFDRLALAAALIWATGAATLIVWRWRQWRTVARLARDAVRVSDGPLVQALQRLPRIARRPTAIEVRLTDANVEPGVVGIVRPILLWPQGLSERLTDDEIAAVLAHEACHVDRHDNLTAVLQVLVETIVWFHPGVWWLSARLVIEREHACDEEVVAMGTNRARYAEGILKVCGFCLRAPAAFVAGVGGSPLTARIERIVSGPASTALSTPARLVLALVVAAIVGTPLAAGVATATAVQQQERQVYKPGEPGLRTPTLVHEVKPNYTREAMQEHIQGTVELTGVVLEDGTVDDVQVTQSLDTEYGLDAEAVATMKKWGFKPGTKDGKPVAVQIEVQMTFTLK